MENYANIKQYIRYIKSYNKQGLLVSSELYLNKAVDLLLELSDGVNVNNDLSSLVVFDNELSELERDITRLKKR